MTRRKQSGEGVEGNGTEQKVVLTKRERFVKYANRRTEAVMKRLQQVANMGNTASYESTEQEREKIIAAVENAVADMKQKLRGVKTAKQAFDLFA